MNVEIDGHRFRVACGSRKHARQLRDALEPHLIADEAALGFLLKAPEGRQRLHLLVDRCGFVLSRSRRPDEALSALAGHLTAFLAPDEGLQRFRMRALVAQDQGVLCLWPVLFVPAVVEKRLAATGFAMLDRLAVDIDGVGRVISTSIAWPSLASLPHNEGHMSTAVSLPISALLVPHSGGARPSRAQLVAQVASTSLGGDRRTALERADAIVRSADVGFIDLHDPASLYAWLRDTRAK